MTEVEQQPAKKRGCGFLILAGLGVFAVISIIGALTGPSEEEQAEIVANRLAEAEASAVPVTAQELWSAFDQNEVAAKAKYGDKPLLVTGTIESITLDFADEPVVSLRTGNQFQSVQMDFDNDDAAQVGALATGQEVTALCTELTEVIGSPMLDGCTLR